MPRYVGNRIHVMFHIAGWIVQHLSGFVNYLTHKCTAELRNKLIEDLQNEDIVNLIWMVAAIGKTITGPWMTEFYCNKAHFDVVILFFPSNFDLDL